MPPTPQRSGRDTAATPLPIPDALPVPDGAACRVYVTFPVRMRPRQTYRCEVRAEIQANRPMLVAPTVGPFTVQPVVPGCLVTPRELQLEATGPAMKFTITPLAEGPIDARLDAWHAGQLWFQVPLRARSISRRSAAWLAAAAAVVPWLWYSFCNAASEPGAIEAAVKRHIPEPLAAVAGLAERAAAACVAWEGTLRVGFWMTIGLLGATAVLALRTCVRVQIVAGGSPVLALGPPPSTRTRPLPPYLTPVPPEEMSQFTG